MREHDSLTLFCPLVSHPQGGLLYFIMSESATADPTDVLLQRPTLVPTGTTVFMHNDPTFLCWEGVAAPQGPKPKAITTEYPLQFQCINVEVVEDPWKRPSDVAAFRQGVLNVEHYKRHAPSTVRPKGGRDFVPEITSRGSRRAARTFIQLTGNTLCNRTITAFVAYDLWFYVEMPLSGAHKLLAELDAFKKSKYLDDDDVHTKTVNKYPLCGWQPEPTTYMHVYVANRELKRDLTSHLSRKGFKVRMDGKPLTEEIMAVMDTDLRHCAHMVLEGGTIVNLEQQTENVDIEVHNVNLECIHCLHADDTGAPPPAAPRRSASWDLEVNDRKRSGKFVNIMHEENRVTQASIIVRQHGIIVPYDPTPLSTRLTKQHPKEADVVHTICTTDEEKKSEPVDPATRPGFDFDAVDDHVEKAKASKAAKLGGEHDFDVARIIVSIYDLPESDEYTVVRVNNEVQLFQAIRRICVRLRVSARIGHNTDGFDSLCQRVRLMLLTHRFGATCWFADHEKAGGITHTAVRGFIDTARHASFLRTLRGEQAAEEVERMRRIRSNKATSRDSEPVKMSKERIGLWAPEQLTDVQLARVVVFNMSLLLDACHMREKVRTLNKMGTAMANICTESIARTSDGVLTQCLHDQGFQSGRHLESVARGLVHELTKVFIAPLITSGGKPLPPKPVKLAILCDVGAAVTVEEIQLEMDRQSSRFTPTHIVVVQGQELRDVKVVADRTQLPLVHVVQGGSLDGTAANLLQAADAFVVFQKPGLVRGLAQLVPRLKSKPLTLVTTDHTMSHGKDMPEPFVHARDVKETQQARCKELQNDILLVLMGCQSIVSATLFETELDRVRRDHPSITTVRTMSREAAQLKIMRKACVKRGLDLDVLTYEDYSRRKFVRARCAGEGIPEGELAGVILAFRTANSCVTREGLEAAMNIPRPTWVVYVGGGHAHPPHARDPNFRMPGDGFPIGTHLVFDGKNTCRRFQVEQRTVWDPTWVCAGRFRMIKHARRYLGIEPMPHILDAEFLNTDVSQASHFKFQVIHTDQKGDRESGNYIANSMLEVDTCTVSQEMWKMKSSKLAALAKRLKVPTKIELPYTTLFDFSDAIRAATQRFYFPAPGERPVPVNAGIQAQFGKVARYCVFDSIVPLECEARMGTFLETMMNGWLSRTHPSDYFRRGVTWRCFTTLICRAFPTCSIIIRSDGFVGDYQGAFCLHPSRGFYENDGSSSVDVNSLYPTAQQMANLCFSTLILDPKHLRTARDMGLEIRTFRFHDKDFHIVQFVKGHKYAREGKLGQMMCFLIGARKLVKRKMKVERDPTQRQVLDKQQKALKVAANGTYGALAFKGFKIPAKCLAAATTFVGREVVMAMKDTINNDFPMERLVELHHEICLRAQVPRRFWRLDKAKRMRDLGGDTDSVFWLQPVPKGDPKTLVVLEWKWTKVLSVTQDDGTVKHKYRFEVTEMPDQTTDEAKVAIARFHKRRAKTQRQRQAGVDKLKKAFKKAQGAGVPEIRRVVCFTEATLSRRIRMVLAEVVTEHMVKNRFNQRQHLVGRQIMGIGVDYVMEKLLLLKKKNYAGLVWESMDLIEDDDFEAKQKGMPSVKADTPGIIAKTFGKLVEELQLKGLDAALEVVEGACRKILANEVPVHDYAKRVKVSDPRNHEHPETIPQLSLYLRMKERGVRGELGTVEIPDIGAQMKMVMTEIPRTNPTMSETQRWEHPDWIVKRKLGVDRVYYLNALLKKMEYIGMKSLRKLEYRVMAFLTMGEHQDRARLMGRSVKSVVGCKNIRTPTDEEMAQVLLLRQCERDQKRGGRMNKKDLNDLVSSGAADKFQRHMSFQSTAKAKKEGQSEMDAFRAAAVRTRMRKKTERKKRRRASAAAASSRRTRQRLF